LLQWVNRFQWLPALGKRPVFGKLRLVQRIPLHDQTQRTLREPSCHNARLDFHDELELGVFSVKLRRRTIAVVHADHDSEKPAWLGHDLPLPVNAPAQPRAFRVGCRRRLVGCREVSCSLFDYRGDLRLANRLARNAPPPHANAIPYGNQAGHLLVGFENPRNTDVARSPPNISAWRWGRWPAIRTATSPPRKLAAAANARWAETSAVDGGPPELPSGIPCMMRSATTPAIQYPAAAISPPATTPPTLRKTTVNTVARRTVKVPATIGCCAIDCAYSLDPVQKGTRPRREAEGDIADHHDP